jgi:branched-chain amino acid transport system ATP-binding protein
MTHAAGLNVRDLVAGYGETVVLDGINLDVSAGAAIALLGRNGVGKTTLLATIMGMTNRHRGDILLGDRRIETLTPHLRARLGIGYVPQQREIFSSLTVEENLAVSILPGGWTLGAIYDLFPRLKERRNNTGNRLSGGEQQMLAIGRALAVGPKVLLLDEPLEGLAPVIVETVVSALQDVQRKSQVTMILVEQKAEMALSMTEHAVVLDRGRVAFHGPSAALKSDKQTLGTLLGATAKEHVPIR